MITKKMIAEAIDSGNYEKVNRKEHLTEFFNIRRATDMVYELIQSQKLFTATQIREKLLQINPQIKEDSKYTNPFLYDDVKKWYEELGK